MEVTRRQFLKISSGAIGTVAAAEAVGLGADTAAAKEQAQTVPVPAREAQTVERDPNAVAEPQE